MLSNPFVNKVKYIYIVNSKKEYTYKLMAVVTAFLTENCTTQSRQHKKIVT